MKIVIKKGFASADRDKVAQLFWQSFSDKLYKILGDREQTIEIIAPQTNAMQSLCAYTDTGELVGVVGLKVDGSSLFNISFTSLVKVFGFWGSLKRIVLLLVLDTLVDKHTLHIEAIFVDQRYRGLDIGTRLLQAVEQEAVANSKNNITLEVVENNYGAKVLYERLGYQVSKKHKLDFLRTFVGFSEVYEMSKLI